MSQRRTGSSPRTLQDLADEPLLPDPVLGGATGPGVLASLVARRPKTVAAVLPWLFAAAFAIAWLGRSGGAPAAEMAVEASAAGLAPARAPIFYISARSYRDAGLQHGQLARERIRGWLATTEMRKYIDYALPGGDGHDAFRRMVADNTAAFPEYAEELQGIAEGAGAPVEEIWVANLINEIENLIRIDGKAEPSGTPWGGGGGGGRHCSDLYAVDRAGGDKQARPSFAHGHNDDWGDNVKPFWYLLAYAPAPGGLDFAGCAGMIYPGSLVGWAITWNQHGMITTQNTLSPLNERRRGLATSFVQRRALCPARSLAEALDGLTMGGWSDAASINIIDTRVGRLANIELWEDRHSVWLVEGNYSHFNEFKHMHDGNGEPIDNPATFRADPRQARVDSLPAPRSARDIAVRLSDHLVYKPTATVATVIFNGSTDLLQLWCGSPSAATPPAYEWHLSSFFDGLGQRIAADAHGHHD